MLTTTPFFELDGSVSAKKTRRNALQRWYGAVRKTLAKKFRKRCSTVEKDEGAATALSRRAQQFVLSAETLVDVFSCMDRDTLDIIELVSIMFNAVVENRLSDRCVRILDVVSLERASEGMKPPSGYYVELRVPRRDGLGRKKMTVGGFSDEHDALQTMLRICRCSVVGRLSFWLSGIRQRLDQQFLKTVLELAPSIFSVRFVSFGNKKVNGTASKTFLEALRSLNGVHEVRLPFIKPHGIRRAAVEHCERAGIRFYCRY